MTVVLPWPLKRWLLQVLLGYKIAPSARIGLSLMRSEMLELGDNARIGHFNYFAAIALVRLAEGAKIGNFNWISGIGRGGKVHFGDEPDRRPELVLGAHAAVTGRHFIDCCNAVHVEEFATVAGSGSQILTHGIDFISNRQRSAPVTIGAYSFVGTASVVIKGAVLPAFSILGANSTLHKAFTEKYRVYSGVPAADIGGIDREALYFRRTQRFVP